MPTEFNSLTASAIARLPRDKTIFFFPVATLESHGPHLPVGLGLLESLALSCELGSRFEALEKGWHAVIMPIAPLGVDSDATRVALRIRGHVLRDWLVDACLALWKQEKFVHFACVSGTLGPKQLTAIEEAGKFLSRRTVGWGILAAMKRSQRPRLFSVSSALVPVKKVFSSPFWPAADEHGGKKDTSVALVLAPGLVEEIYRSLPPVMRGSGAFEHLFARLQDRQPPYWGTPSEAKAELGQNLIHEKADQVFHRLRAVIEGAPARSSFRSWYSVLPPNWSFFQAWIIVFIVFFTLCLWLYLNIYWLGY